jgi:hypothetical protein
MNRFAQSCFHHFTHFPRRQGNHPGDSVRVALPGVKAVTEVYIHPYLDGVGGLHGMIFYVGESDANVDRLAQFFVGPPKCMVAGFKQPVVEPVSPNRNQMPFRDEDLFSQSQPKLLHFAAGGVLF